VADGIHELTAAYALDALGSEERSDFEAHLGTCPRCQEELASFWQVAGSMAYAAGGPQPSRELRGRILETARAERPNVVPLRPRGWAFPAAAAIAAVAAVVAVGLGLWAHSLSSSLDDSRSALADQRAAAAVLADPRAQTVALQGADGKLVVEPTGRAALVVSSLEPAPSGKTYEMWVIQDGMAAPAGLFDSRNGRAVTALERRVPTGATVGVTVEAAQGATAPTSAPIFSAKRA